MKLVYRPTTRDGARRLRELRDALDAEGVAPGGPFWISAGPDLSGPGSVRTADPDTARQAAMNPRLDRAPSRLAVLRALAHLGEATSREIAEHLGWDRSSVSPRLAELVKRYDPPLVQKTGRTRAGQGPGVQNETWELTDAGRAMLAAQNGAS